ncbi:DUF2269 family protein [Bacillus suaedaesalsae]|uniref:DUF2269 family protein n=1 Tax=Bacillus suaedaesalsae TaxID=2810349 RepID=UPI001EF4F4DD|nr:DUF2269 family protein [Bacillus suaedaesalsae]
MLKVLVLIHVLSAIIGVGPTFFGHVLYRKKQNAEDLRHSMKLSNFLNFFPKIGGTLAVVTGIILVVVGNYGSFFTTLWLIGSLVIYILIQIVVIAIIDPKAKKLAAGFLLKETKQLQTYLQNKRTNSFLLISYSTLQLH